MIKLTDVTVCYGEKRVLDRLTLALPESGLVTVSGPSGAGKTTLLRVLCGLTQPDTGSVEGLEGRKLGVVFQEDRLLPWETALDNLALVAPRADAREMLARLGLEEAANLRPSALSGGMARRVAIARALLFCGDVLLLDEPFTGLDDETKKRAADCVRRAAKLIVLVTHDVSEEALFSCGADFVPLPAKGSALSFAYAPLAGAISQ